jgi:lipopolysaccharide transport system ATP-binding protein
MSKPIIEVKGISKCYKLGSIGAQTMRDEVEAFFARFKKNKPIDPTSAENSKLKTANSAAGSSEFWALRDVSFDVQPGEVVGIIGRNGAGKSTLLKILSRITEPTSGEIRVRGRIASLLEVGTGFHPELSGRENIFLNGAILGMTKAEIRAKFDEIVDFAGVEQFIDTPVKRYSSGMYVRLAFAVAAHLEPEILIVDEVLAVGDAEFQKKCLGKMKDVAGHGRTILFVSHNMSAVLQLTSSALVMEHGHVSFFGETSTAVEKYFSGGVTSSVTTFNLESKPRKFDGTGAARLVSLKYDRLVPIFHPDEDFQFTAKIHAFEEIANLRFSMTVFTSDGTPVGSCFGPDNVTMANGTSANIQVSLPRPKLAPGQYYCGLAIGKGNHKTGHTDFDVVLDTLPFEIRPAEGDQGTLSTWTRGWGSVVFEPLNQELLDSSDLR